MSEQISLLQAFILGVVEGITEFLPISSTGHLLVCSQMIGAANTSGTYEIVIQLGAVLAVVGFYWKRLWAKVSEWRQSPAKWAFKEDSSPARFWVSLLLAFLPAAIVGLALKDYLDLILGSRELQVYIIAATLFGGGIILWWVDRPGRLPAPAAKESEQAPAEGSRDGDSEGQAPVKSAEVNLTYRQAFWVGVAQCFSLIPGVSRSGATIVGGLMVGLNRAQATDFSFFLSIPTLGAATIYTLLRSYETLLAVSTWQTLSVGMVVSFITAWLAIGWLLRYVASNTFLGFAIYRMAAGVLLALWGWYYL